MSDQAYEVPILDLLRSIPLGARMTYEHSPIMHSMIPVGIYAYKAADTIERLTRELASARFDAGLAEGAFQELYARQADVRRLTRERDEARAEVERRMMESGWNMAAKAVLMQALAEQARNGNAEWAQAWLARADAAARAVQIKDFTVAQLNTAARGEQEGRG